MAIKASDVFLGCMVGGGLAAALFPLLGGVDQKGLGR